MNLFATSTFLQRFTPTKSLLRAPLVDLPEYGDAPGSTVPKTRNLSAISSTSSSSSTTSSAKSVNSKEVQIEIPLSPLKKKKSNGTGRPLEQLPPAPRRKTISRLSRTVLFYMVYFACLFSFLRLFLGALFYILSRRIVYLEEQHRAAMLAEAQRRSAAAAVMNE